ncbi:MAG: hypothetical protein NWE75_05960 [Candidatus Bathyarchaeota archaeon]|nr:hypothetical protein [Candidatus Bathyarchaeota archaeon]
MNRRSAIFVILMVACAFLLQIQIASAEFFEPHLKVSANDVYLTAGEENKIEITLRNVGDFGVYQVKATLSVPSTTPGISIIEGAHNIFNKIDEGEKRTYYPVIYVDRSTPLGAYTLTYQVSYIKIGEIPLETTTVQIGVVVNRVSKPELGLDMWMEPMKLSAGAEGDAAVEIENIGSEPVYRIEARVTSTTLQIAVLEGSKFTHESLETEGRVSFTPTLAVSRHAPIGVYTLTASVSYQDGDGRDYIETFTLGVTVDSVLVANQTSVVMTAYSTNPETINPGDNVDLTLELECIGATAHDVKATLNLDPLTGISTLSPTLVSLGRLEPGQIVESSYRLLIGGEVMAGQYPVTVALSYLDADGAPRSLVERVTLSIRGIVDFSLINEESVKAEIGEVTEFEADLLLVGTESVRFVVVEVVEDEAFLRTSWSEEYIGAVDPDSPIPFRLEFEVAGGTESGDYRLDLRVTYTDDLNREHEEAIDLQIDVVEAVSEEVAAVGPLGGLWLWLRRLFGLMP